MTLDRHGAVAVCKVGCQQSLDWFEKVKICWCTSETLGDLHGFARDLGESKLDGEARVGNGKVEEEVPRLTL